MQKGILIVIGIGIIIASLFYFLIPTSNENDQQQVQEVTGEPTITIVRTNEGYVPNEVTIKKGDIVLWTNESDEYHWPASDLHPTHGVYPEFDPLKPIAPGDEWKFQFNQVGEWKFHDHIRANKVGTIIVED